MSETKKKTAAPKPVSKKPYLTGTPLDSSCIGGALRFFLYLLMMAIAFLFLGAVLSFDSFTLRLIINLAVVLPESLTSPTLTAEWENRLTEIAKGNADADEFMAEIEAQVRQLVKTYSCISADKQNLFQSERIIIGKCPRCGENVYEGKKNFYCGNRGCQFVMWKNDRFFEQRKKAFTPKIAAALLKNGKAKVKGLYSEKTGKTYDATVLLADTGGKYVNYRVERKE